MSSNLFQKSIFVNQSTARKGQRDGDAFIWKRTGEVKLMPLLKIRVLINKKKTGAKYHKLWAKILVRNPRNADAISNSGRMLTDSVRGLHASHSKKKDVRNVEKKQQFKSEKKV